MEFVKLKNDKETGLSCCMNKACQKPLTGNTFVTSGEFPFGGVEDSNVILCQECYKKLNSDTITQNV